MRLGAGMKTILIGNRSRGAQVGRLALSLSLLLPILFLSACADILRHPAPPPTFEGFDKVRYYPLDAREGHDEWNDWTVMITETYKNESPENYVIGADGVATYSYLAISGGGSDGAFGAGLLNG